MQLANVITFVLLSFIVREIWNFKCAEIFGTLCILEASNFVLVKQSGARNCLISMIFVIDFLPKFSLKILLLYHSCAALFCQVFSLVLFLGYNMKYLSTV